MWIEIYLYVYERERKRQSVVLSVGTVLIFHFIITWTVSCFHFLTSMCKKSLISFDLCSLVVLHNTDAKAYYYIFAQTLPSV